MGRLFVTNLEGPAYQCKHCRKVEIASYVDPNERILPPFEYHASLGKLYYFSKCFNVVIATDETTMTINGETYNSMREVFCIACGSLLGLYYEGAVSVTYNEGNFYINRFKLHRPPQGSDDDEHPGNEEQVV